MTRNLIILNIIVFIATLINQEFMTAEFALFYPTSRYFHWWQVLTHMFMHGGFWHILFNMYTLWLFGSVVENIIGSKKFLLFYFVCGLGAAGLHLGVEFLQMQSFMEGAATGTVAGVAHFAHLGGMLIGWLMIFYWRKRGKLFDKDSL